MGFLKTETNGAEFFNNGKPIDVRIVVNDERITDRDIFLLTGEFVSVEYFSTGERRTYNPAAIIENMPKGGGSCTGIEWDGINQSCADRRIPYTPSLGPTLCVTLADFANDPHCGQWAIANRGDGMDVRLKSLCANTQIVNNLPQGQQAICNCFRPD